MGDIITLTRNEYRAMSPSGSVRLPPLPQSVCHVRIDSDLSVRAALPHPFWRHALWNPAVAQHDGNQRRDRGAAGLMIWLVGLGSFLLVQGPIVVVSATIAVWFFYVQHQFEDDALGRTTAIGAFTKPRFTGVRITSCRRPSPGSPAISGCITCTTCRAQSLSIGFPRSCGPIRSSARSSPHAAAQLRCVRLAFWDEEKRRLLSFARRARACRQDREPPPVRRDLFRHATHEVDVLPGLAFGRRRLSLKKFDNPLR